MTGAALVDIDGTLVDSNHLHTLAWWRACRSLGITVPMSRLHRLVGMGSDQLTRELTGRDRPDLADAHSREFRLMHNELTALPGAAELLRACRRLGLRVVLATSAKEQELERLLDVIDARDAVDDVAFSGEVEESKPEPDIIGRALEKAGVPPHHAVLVGDTRWDIEAGRRAGVPCVCVETGGWSAADLTGAGAVAVYADAAALAAGLGTSPLGALARGAG